MVCGYSGITKVPNNSRLTEKHRLVFSLSSASFFPIDDQLYEIRSAITNIISRCTLRPHFFLKQRTHYIHRRWWSMDLHQWILAIDLAASILRTSMTITVQTYIALDYPRTLFWFWRFLCGTAYHWIQFNITTSFRMSRFQNPSPCCFLGLV